jgi:hypothetical protein
MHRKAALEGAQAAKIAVSRNEALLTPNLSGVSVAFAAGDGRNIICSGASCFLVAQ